MPVLVYNFSTLIMILLYDLHNFVNVHIIDKSHHH